MSPREMEDATREEILQQLLVSLEEKHRLRRAVEALTAEVAGVARSFYESGDYHYLRKRGVRDPEEEVIADLQNHVDLVRHYGKGGADMAFSVERRTRLLGRKWVLAEFSDGRVTGKALLGFSVLDSGEISWELIDSYTYD